MTHKLRHDGFIGEGTLYIRRLDRKDLDFSYMGNAQELSVSMESEVKERISKMRENYGAVLNTVILPKSGELKITLDDFNEENLAMVFMGALEKAKMTTKTITDKALLFIQADNYIHLGDAYIKANTVELKREDDSVIDAEHYIIHERMGFIQIKESALLNPNDKIKISYQTHDFNSWIIQANTQSQIQCEIILDGRNRVNGADVKLHIPKATLSTSGAFNFFSDDFNTIELVGRPEVLEGNIAPFTVTIKA